MIKTSDIKDHPTIQMLESFVKTAGKKTKREIQENYPLTNTQEGIFIECTANMGSTIYNIPYLLKLDKRLTWISWQKQLTAPLQLILT